MIGPARRIEWQCGDAVLLEEYRQGSREAAEALFERFHEGIFGLAWWILKDENAAEEAVKEVFLAAAKQSAVFAGDLTLDSWLRRLCVRVCLMRSHRERRQGRTAVETFLPAFSREGRHAGFVRDWSGDVERKIPDGELGKRIREFTMELSEPERLVLVLRDLEGFSDEATARILGLTAETVRLRLCRARLYLRGRLSRQLEGNSAG